MSNHSEKVTAIKQTHLTCSIPTAMQLSYCWFPFAVNAYHLTGLRTRHKYHARLHW